MKIELATKSFVFLFLLVAVCFAQMPSVMYDIEEADCDSTAHCDDCLVDIELEEDVQGKYINYVDVVECVGSDTFSSCVYSPSKTCKLHEESKAFECEDCRYNRCYSYDPDASKGINPKACVCEQSSSTPWNSPHYHECTASLVP